MEEYAKALFFLAGVVKNIYIRIEITGETTSSTQLGRYLHNESGRDQPLQHTIEIPVLLNDLLAQNPTSLRELALLFQGTKPGNRITFNWLSWTQESGASPGDLVRSSWSYIPKREVGLIDALRICILLIKHIRGHCEKRLSNHSGDRSWTWCQCKNYPNCCEHTSMNRSGGFSISLEHSRKSRSPFIALIAKGCENRDHFIKDPAWRVQFPQNGRDYLLFSGQIN